MFIVTSNDSGCFFSECMLSYGDNCQYRCDVNCINKTCDRINGSCLHGCIEGKQCHCMLAILGFRFVIQFLLEKNNAELYEIEIFR